MSEPLNHEQALDALCNCAATVTVLSYQEAIEGYFSLRGWKPPTDAVHDLYDSIRDQGLIDPILVRASLAASIGKESPFPTRKAAADHYGVHPEQLRMFILGIRPELEPKLAAALGLERVVFYRAAQGMAPVGPRPKGSGSSALPSPVGPADAPKSEPNP